MRTVLAFLAAALFPTCLMTGWYLYGQFATFEANDPYIWVRTRGFLFMCLWVATAFVVVLGVPAYFLLRKLNAVRWWSTVATGFILGAVPYTIFAWPLQYAELHSSSTVDGVQTMIDGIPTAAGWIQFTSAALFFGACGAVGALAFWAVSRK